MYIFPFYWRTLLVMWLSCYLCFHFLCIRIRMKSYFLNYNLVSFLNFNLGLTHFVTWKVGTECRQMSDKEKAPRARDSQAIKSGDWVSMCSYLDLEGERTHCDLPRPDFMASLAFAFSQNLSLKEIVCLRVFGVNSIGKLGVQDREKMYIFLYIFIWLLNIWSDFFFHFSHSPQ